MICTCKQLWLNIIIIDLARKFTFHKLNEAHDIKGIQKSAFNQIAGLIQFFGRIRTLNLLVKKRNNCGGNARLIIQYFRVHINPIKLEALALLTKSNPNYAHLLALVGNWG